MGSAVLSRGIKLGDTGWRYLFHYKVAAGPASLPNVFQQFFRNIRVCHMRFI